MKHMQEEIQHTPNLEVKEAAVDDIILDSTNNSNKVAGIITSSGDKIFSKTVVLTTGTFLGGVVHIGNYSQSSGRIGEPAANSLSQTLQRFGFPLNRLRTGV
jgi:tRNA uridine 5-carboxymethylaminomethyl modification enzyme